MTARQQDGKKHGNLWEEHARQSPATKHEQCQCLAKLCRQHWLPMSGNSSATVLDPGKQGMQHMSDQKLTAMSLKPSAFSAASVNSSVLGLDCRNSEGISLQKPVIPGPLWRCQNNGSQTADYTWAVLCHQLRA